MDSSDQIIIMLAIIILLAALALVAALIYKFVIYSPAKDASDNVSLAKICATNLHLLDSSLWLNPHPSLATCL